MPGGRGKLAARLSTGSAVACVKSERRTVAIGTFVADEVARSVVARGNGKIQLQSDILKAQQHNRAHVCGVRLVPQGVAAIP